MESPGLGLLAKNLARLGVGKITMIDFDKVEAANLSRQDFNYSDIGKYKVDAIREAIGQINRSVHFTGVRKKLQDLSEQEEKAIFCSASLIIFGTDSFAAQSYGNILALRYDIPAIWAGWYAHSRTAELFFQIPSVTPACFRCATSSRYKANEKKEVQVSSQSNTILHSQLLDTLIGFITLGIIHRSHSKDRFESARFYTSLQKNGVIDRNFFQFKAHPDGGNRLFDAAFENSSANTPVFQSFWQSVEPELKLTGYDYDCPDCMGKLLEMIPKDSEYIIKNKLNKDLN